MDRRYDIDWLRIFATYLLFVFHAGMIFSPAPFYHVRNAEVSSFMLVLTGFISLWHMPLFFVLAGWSAHASLSTRGTRRFVHERFLRLGVPLLAGCVLIGPVLKYFELKSGLDLSHTGLRVAPHLQESFRSVIPAGLPIAPPFRETFFEFLPTFFTSLNRFTWGHLWFVAYLLTFTLLYLPLFNRLIGRAGEARCAVPRGANAKPWSAAWVYMPAILLAAIQVFLRPYWPGIQNLYDDWANFAYYSTFLILGFLLACAPGFESAVHREAKRAFALSIAVMLVLLGGVLHLYESQWLLLAGSAAAGWFFVVSLLGFAHQRLTHQTRGLDYLRESAFPVYILHQPALVLIGYAIVSTSLGIAPKYLAIVVLALLATLAFYHFAVRRSRVLRFLHGMKPLPAPVTGRVARASVAATLSLALWTCPHRAEAASTVPIGLWWAEGGAAQVEILPCMESLCARVAWLRSPLGDDGCDLRDAHNPEPADRARPVLGLQIMQGLRAANADAREWIGGTIYDPATGSTYSCRMSLEDDDTLLLRGYVGFPIIGRTTKWFRVDARTRRCER